MKQIGGKSLVGTAFDVVHSSIHYSGFLLLVIAFTDVYVRYERVAETQQQLNDELAKFDEIQREEIGERHRRAVKDDNVVVAGIEKKFAQLELRMNRSDAFEALTNSPFAYWLPYLRGPAGPPGKDGEHGEPGDAGKIGRAGKIGPKGKMGADYKHNWEYTGSTSYVRWGKKGCPNVDGTRMVYTGIAAGQYYTHKGGMSNTVCLHSHPNFAKHSKADTGQHIYGLEYEISAFNPFSKAQHNTDAPCAVCTVHKRGSHIMVPGRNICPAGWTMEYKGYLMSAHYGHAGRTSAVCVDDDAEAFPRSQASKDGNLWYFIQGSCGSLPCGPYVQGRELTCAVCTK